MRKVAAATQVGRPSAIFDRVNIQIGILTFISKLIFGQLSLANYSLYFLPPPDLCTAAPRKALVCASLREGQIKQNRQLISSDKS